MSFFTYKNTKLFINGNPYYVQNASISESAEIEPGYNINSKYNINYSAQNGIGGSIKFSYLLTGEDAIANNISQESDSINVNFAGLYFNQGYLRSYSFNLEPNNPTVINAEIVFFDSLSGTFSPNYELAPELKCLNVSDVQLKTIAGNSIGKINNVTRLSYDYNIDVSPRYKIGEVIPSRVVFGPKQVNVNIVDDKLNNFLSVSGQKVSLRTTLVHPEDTGIFQNFDCKGILYQKEFSTNSNNLLNYQISVKQNDLSNFNVIDGQNTPKPVVYFISPNTGYNGTQVTISGINLSYVNYVFYSDNIIDNNFQIINDTQIKSFAPANIISGPLTLYSSGGSVNTKIFYVGGLPITINDIIPITGNVGSSIQISGNNFYEISRVLFNNNQTGVFSRINSNIIEAIVPNNASWGYIDVISDIFSISGRSLNKFVPIANIVAFSPTSGFSGDYILISGNSFSGVTGVKINNLPTGNTDVFTIINNTGILVQIPSGNTKGTIRLYGQSGTVSLSTQSFYPYSILTGVTPASGHTGELIQISGKNFIPEILYNFGSNQFAVSFQGGVTGYFKILSNILISGAVPSGAKSGIINVYSQNLDTYPSNLSFLVRENPPILNYFSPTSGKRLDYISIVGSNFSNINSIIVSGQNTGSNIISSNYSISNTEDYINLQIPNITGGIYNILINGLEGNTSGSGLYILENPYVSGFNPISGGAGTQVSFTGLNLYSNLSQIWIDGSGTQAQIYSGNNNDTIKFNIPSNITSGNHNIIIYNTVNSGSGNQLFKFIPYPTPSGFFPLSGQWGDSILLSGSYFDLVSSLSISNTGINNYSITSSTGITFIIPNNSSTDYIKLNNYAGFNYTSTKLIVVPPIPIISGFIPQNTYYNSGVVISGNYLNTVRELHFSGSTGGYISLTNFSGIGETGITFTVPGGIVNGLIRAVNSKGYGYSPYQLTLISGAQINLVSQQTGAFKDLILISGSGLSGSIPYLNSINGSLIIGDNISRIGDTGLYFNIPSGVVSSSIIVRSRNDSLSSDTGNLVILPTITGFSGYNLFHALPSFDTGSYITISGINADELMSFIGISGNGTYYNILYNSEFTGINQTGYSIINARISDVFAGTGRLFLAYENDNIINSNITGSITYANINKVLFGPQVIIQQPAPLGSSVSPSKGNKNTIVTFNGRNLLSTFNVVYSNGVISQSGIIISKTNTQVLSYPPSINSGIGDLTVYTPFGNITFTPFTILPIINISGYTPTSGHINDTIRISGSGLASITGLKFSSYNAVFSGAYENAQYYISGIVPTGSCCGETVTICVLNEGDTACL